MKKSPIKIIKQILGYCVGMFVLAIGVCFCIASNMGLSPISSIPYVLSTCNHWDLGFCTTAVLVVVIFAQFLVNPREFKAFMLLELIASTLFGLFVGFVNNLFLWLPIAGNYGMQLAYTIIGTITIALGVMIYMDHNLVSLPVEGLAQAIASRFHREFSTMKMAVDWAMVILATGIGYILSSQIVGIREGTLLCAFGVGFCIKWFRKWLPRKS